MAEVAFRPLQSWALPPEKPRTDRGAARAERDTYRDSFRYLRIPRLPADCPPWVLGQELGWAVRSPVTLTMKPLDDIGIAVPEREDAHQAGRRLGGAGIWQRGEEWIAARNADWLHLGDYRAANGSWEGMFLPNGQGTVEWRLGWAATIPARTFLMVMPPPGSGPDGLRVPLGVIPAKSVNAMADRGGMSIAVEPERPVTVHRGQEIARIVLLHPDSLRASTHQRPAEPESSIPLPEHPAEAAGHGQETGR
ncbi:hypothetical protein OH797_38140 (plasmid) [Streptomyces anulatus]|uniref:hypothetical protein n=1 Tax=Streptomyces anulatus TaxID=1892 RepID=UPI002F909256|nr:hypothetical protein OG865_38925 [Streptomyces anulatus]